MRENRGGICFSDATLSLSIMSATCKRKRDEYESSDDEGDHAVGRQALPVADLPFDFDGEPEDGAQYLFTVRYVGFRNQASYAISSDRSALEDVMRICFLVFRGLTIRMQH
jgi:hypothetical protein